MVKQTTVDKVIEHLRRGGIVRVITDHPELGRFVTMYSLPSQWDNPNDITSIRFGYNSYSGPVWTSWKNAKKITEQYVCKCDVQR